MQADTLLAPCNRVQVVSRDRAITLTQYTVEESDYVIRMRYQIERFGQDGVWSVAAGELGQLGYTVTYSCLP